MSVLNEMTVDEFLGIYSPEIQDRMSRLDFYFVSDGLVKTGFGGVEREKKENSI